MSLSRFISLLKNVRTLVYVNPSLPIRKKELQWVIKKHKYRTVGISPLLLNAFEEEIRKEFKKKPFATLNHAFKELEKLTQLIHSFKTDIHAYFWDTLILASSYVAPILFFGRESFKSVKDYAVWTMTSTSSLPEVEIKRNLRIIGYAVLDFHEELTSNAYDVLINASKDLLKGKGSIEKVEKWIEKRRKKISKDGEHRFWRLKEKGKIEERPVIAYFDLAPIFLEAFHELEKMEARELVSFISTLTTECKIALGAVASFILEL